MPKKPTHKCLAAAAAVLCARFAPSLSEICDQDLCKLYTKQVADSLDFTAHGSFDTAAYIISLLALAAAVTAAGTSAPARVSAGGFSAVANDPLALADALRREASRVLDAARGNAPAVRALKG